ncbi:unnamed protein product [Brachionus calyciflorus]|uniref:Fido domain-containing protein n=1 Tax=Brachionus calyciflorus TaxID=104777 RepID=A0A814KD94_9BILA|nr:unnamed protein product [Brachionus calyciflorus]
MDINFDIPEKNVWWRPNYWPYTNQIIFKQIESFKNLFLKAKEDTEFQKELNRLSLYYHTNFIYECLKGEKNINDDELEINNVERIIECGSRSSKIEVKIQNLYRAIFYLFPDPFFPSLEIKGFTTDLAKKLHEIIGYELWDNSGVYRKLHAKPSKEDYEYAEPHLIEEKLESLFENTRFLLEKYSGIHERIKIGALFFTMFLDIHPFSNGNGRISRLLLSFILSNTCVVPIGLYYSQDSRETYLKCLRESRLTFSHTYSPLALSAFILESALKNLI